MDLGRVLSAVTEWSLVMDRFGVLSWIELESGHGMDWSLVMDWELVQRSRARAACTSLSRVLTAAAAAWIGSESCLR